jgi:hypothetical protein
MAVSVFIMKQNYSPLLWKCKPPKYICTARLTHPDKEAKVYPTRCNGAASWSKTDMQVSAKISNEARIVVVLRNNGQERLLLSSSPDLIPPLEMERVAKSSFMTPAPVRNNARRQA